MFVCVFFMCVCLTSYFLHLLFPPLHKQGMCVTLYGVYALSNTKKIYVIKITPLFDVLCLFTFSLCFCYYKIFVCQLLNLGFRLFLECSFVSLFRSRA